MKSHLNLPSPMAQRAAYFQNILGGQPSSSSPTPYAPSSYSQARRSPQGTSSPVHYSGLSGYGTSGTPLCSTPQRPFDDAFSDASQAPDVAISHRSRTSPHHSNFPTDYPRTHHQLSHSHAPVPWDGHSPQPYGYEHVSSSSYTGQSWPVNQTQSMGQQSYYQRNDLHDQGGQYMGMVGVANGGLSRGPSSGSSILPANHSSQQWAGSSGTTSDSHSYYMFSNDPHFRPSPDMPASGYAFSPAPSPSSSPSPSRVTDMSPDLGPRRASIDATNNVKRCSHCQATSTPLWRRNPMNMQPLCNACGLYLQQRNKLRPQELIDASIEDDESTDESDIDPSAPRCSHCQTHVTSVWRRSKTGEQLCNACGVYLRLRGKPRPLSLKQKKIKPRPHSSKNAAK